MLNVELVMRIVFVAVGHPLLYLSILFKSGYFFIGLGAGVARLNLFLFVPYIIALYLSVLGLQFILFKKLKKVTFKNFVRVKLGVGSKIISGLGLLHILLVSVPMEMNAYGILFFPFFLLLAFASLLVFLFQTKELIWNRKEK